MVRYGVWKLKEQTWTTRVDLDKGEAEQWCKLFKKWLNSNNYIVKKYKALT